MSTIGHLSVSYLAGKINRDTCMWAILLGGILPDADFLLLPFPFFNQVHRLITHNLPFLIVSALIIAFWAKERRRAVASGIIFGGVLHLLVDACMDSNPSNGIGVAVLWPFYDGYFSLFNLMTPSGDAEGWGNPLKMIKGVWRSLRFEIPLYLTAIITLFFEKRRSGD
jgi:membrane-bound metal-dependent hydrolase YbcI (DUF457 family)